MALFGLDEVEVGVGTEDVAAAAAAAAAAATRQEFCCPVLATEGEPISESIEGSPTGLVSEDVFVPFPFDERLLTATDDTEGCGELDKVY